jgi:hypothetical protein
MWVVVAGALLLGALSTFYDFVWARFGVEHSMLSGVVHGMTLLSAAGLVLGLPPRRPVAGLVGGAAVGLLAAASFYAVYPFMTYLGAIVAAWMLLWLLFGVLEAMLRRARLLQARVLARGLVAAVLSGLAFWLISDIWTDHTKPVNHAWNFLRWSFAYFPGVAALLLLFKDRATPPAST